MLKKIIFPFFEKNHHGFLTNNWKFRLLIMVYIILFIVFFIYLLNYEKGFYWGWCYHDINPYLHDEKNYLENAFNYCDMIKKESVVEMWVHVIFFVLITHYLIQFFFFKVIINYVVLGGKNIKDNRSSS